MAIQIKDMIEKSHLEMLIGKSVTKTDMDTSTVFPIIKKKDDLTPARMNITLQLYLEEYLLNINNPITISPSNIEFDELTGLKVVAVYESKQEAKLIFDNSNVLSVNLRDEVYWDPEAMILYGPDNFCAVWN